MSAWRIIAHLSKTRNLQGSLVAHAAEGLPFLLSEGLDVRFVPPLLRGPRSARVADVEPLGGGAWQVRFEGVGADEASQLVGRSCLAARADLPVDVSAQAAAAPVGLEGWQVEDAALGALGRIVRVDEGPAQALLVVSGPRGEVMIPVVDEFVRAVDEPARTVRTAIPEGLLHL